MILALRRARRRFLADTVWRSMRRFVMCRTGELETSHVGRLTLCATTASIARALFSAVAWPAFQNLLAVPKTTFRPQSNDIGSRT